jgi:hypothetical protein
MSELPAGYTIVSEPDAAPAPQPTGLPEGYTVVGDEQAFEKSIEPTTRTGALLKAAANASDESIAPLPFHTDRDTEFANRKRLRDTLKQEVYRRGGYDAAAGDEKNGGELQQIAGQLLTSNQSAMSDLMQRMEARARDQGQVGTFIDNMGQGIGSLALPVLRGGTKAAEKLTGSNAARNFGNAQDLAQLQTSLETANNYWTGLAGMGTGMAIDMVGGPGALASSGMNKVLAPLLNPVIGLAEKSALRAILEGTPAAQVLTRNLPDNVIRGAINFGTLEAAPHLIAGDFEAAADAFKHGAAVGAIFHSVNQHAQRETFDQFMRRNGRYGNIPADVAGQTAVDPMAWQKAAPSDIPPLYSDEGSLKGNKQVWKDYRTWTGDQDAQTLQQTLEWMRQGPQEQPIKVARQLIEEELDRRASAAAAAGPAPQQATETKTAPSEPIEGAQVTPGEPGGALSRQEPAVGPSEPIAGEQPPTPTTPPNTPPAVEDNSPAAQLRRQAEETRLAEQEFNRAKAESDQLLEQAKKAAGGGGKGNTEVVREYPPRLGPGTEPAKESPPEAAAEADVPKPWESGKLAKHTEEVPLSELKKLREFEKPTAMDPEKRELLAESMATNGIRDPLIIEYNPATKKAVLAEGHHRLELAEEMGWSKLPVRVVTVDTARPKHQVPGHTGEPARALKPSDILAAATEKTPEPAKETPRRDVGDKATKQPTEAEISKLSESDNSHPREHSIEKSAARLRELEGATYQQVRAQALHNNIKPAGRSKNELVKEILAFEGHGTPAEIGKLLQAQEEQGVTAADADFVNTFPRMLTSITQSADALGRLGMDVEEDPDDPEFLKEQHGAWGEELVGILNSTRTVGEALRTSQSPATGKPLTLKERQILLKNQKELQQQYADQFTWYEDHFGEAAAAKFRAHVEGLADKEEETTPAADEGEKPPTPKAEEEAGDLAKQRPDLEAMKPKELKAFAAKLGIKGKNTKQLIERIRDGWAAYDQQQAEEKWARENASKIVGREVSISTLTAEVDGKSVYATGQDGVVEKGDDEGYAYVRIHPWEGRPGENQLEGKLAKVKAFDLSPIEGGLKEDLLEPNPEEEPTDETPAPPAQTQGKTDDGDNGQQGEPAFDDPHRTNIFHVEIKGRRVPVESLDAGAHDVAQAIVAGFNQLDLNQQLRLARSSRLVVDRAYRTIYRPVEVPELSFTDEQTGKTTTDTTLWAEPGKERDVAAIGRKMADVGMGPHGPEAAPYKLQLKKPKKAPPTKPPKAVETDAQKIEAVAQAAGDDGARYALDSVFVAGKGSELVASDGHQLFHIKRGAGEWGDDGLYKVPDKSGKLVPKETGEGVKFPPHEAILDRMGRGSHNAVGGSGNHIDVERTLRRARQIVSMASEPNAGVVVVLNKDGSLGFAAAQAGMGMAEVGVDLQGEVQQLGGVDIKLFIKALEFHAKMGGEQLKMWWPDPSKAITLERIGADQRVTTVTMPIKVEPDEAAKIRKDIKAPGMVAGGDVPPEPEEEPGGQAAAPSHAFAQPSNVAGSGEVLVTPPEIIKLMEQMTGTPMRVGHGSFGLRKALGWFDPKRDVIRNKIAEDLATAVHEFGHSVHAKIIGWYSRWPSQIVGELTKMGKELYGSRVPNGGYRREGLAEYVARFMLGDNTANFPETHKWFTETILPGHPEFAKQWGELKEMFEAWNQQGAAGRIAAKINRIDNSISGRVHRGFEFLQQKLWRAFRTSFTSDAAPLEDAVKRIERETGSELPFRQNPAKIRQALAMTYAGTAREFVSGAALGRDFHPVGPGLAQVLRPVKAKLDEFVIYAYARRGLDLLARGINPGITARDAMQAVRQFKSPEFEAALDGVTQWSNELVGWLVSAGGLSPEAAQTIRDLNPIYVPLKRFFDENQLGGGGGGGRRGVVNQGSGVKKIKGSGRSIIDPIEALALQAEATIKLANKLDVSRAIIELAEKNNGLGWFAHKVETPKIGTSFSLDEIAKQLEAMGVDLSQADLSELLSVFDNAQQYYGKDNIVVLWRNGQREFWELDPDVFKVVTEMDKELVGPILRTFAFFKRGVQLGATGFNPGFAFIKNPLRDMLTHFAFTKSTKPGRLFYGWFDGLQKELRGDRYSHLWKAAGGEMGTLMGQDRAQAGTIVREGLVETKGERAVFTLRHPVDAARKFFGLFESAPRISEFITVLQEKAKQTGGVYTRAAVLEALLASKDVTVDFTRAGTVGRALNMMVPFFNARVQGGSKFFRTFLGFDGRGPALKAWGRMFPIVLGSVLLWWMNRDQEWYQKRDNWEKENYWLFSPDGGKHVIRIPKGDIGYAFGTVPVQAVQSAHDKDPEAATSALVDSAGQFLPIGGPMDLVPAMLRPSVEAVTNYDGFRGKSIDSEGDMNKLPRDRYSDYTSGIAKQLGAWLGVSPKRIDHLLRGYSGGMATDLIRVGEQVAGKPRANASLSDAPIVGTLFSRDPSSGGAFATKLYDRLQQLTERKGSKVLTFDELREFNRLEEISLDLNQLRRERDLEPANADELERRMTAEAKWAVGKAPDVPLELAGKGYFRAQIREALIDGRGGELDDIARQIIKSGAVKKPTDVKALIDATKSGLVEQMLDRMAQAIQARDQKAYNRAMTIAVHSGLKPLRQNAFLQGKAVPLQLRNEFLEGWKRSTKPPAQVGR